jgi:hypothetical protein
VGRLIVDIGVASSSHQQLKTSIRSNCDLWYIFQ